HVPPQYSAPHNWRCYLEWLLRAEQLARAGGDFQPCLDRAQGHEQLLRFNPWPNLTSTGNAIPLSAALANDRSPRLDATALNQLWSAPDIGEQNKSALWLLIRGSVPEQEVTGLAADVAAPACVTLLTDRVRHEQNLANAARLLSAVFGAANPPPTEAQFIQLLHRDLSRQARPDPGLIRLALQTRRTAEKIA